MRRLSLLTIAALATFAGSLSAQLCGGMASFAINPYQISGSGLFNDNSKSFLGGFGFGGKGPFGGIALGTASYDDVDGSSFLYGATAGYQAVLDQKQMVHLCPIVALDVASGPNNLDVFGDGSFVIDVSETDIAFGVGMGVLASRSTQTQIIPNVLLSFVSGTVKVHDDVSGVSDKQSETWGLLGLGLGFVFNEKVSLHPSVNIPFGLEDAPTTFGVTLGVNFGAKRP